MALDRARTSSNLKCEKYCDVLTSSGANGAPKTSLASDALRHDAKESNSNDLTEADRILDVPAIVAWMVRIDEADFVKVQRSMNLENLSPMPILRQM